MIQFTLLLFLIGSHKSKHCVKCLKNLGSDPVVTYIGADLEPLYWSFNDRTVPINFSKCLKKYVA